MAKRAIEIAALLHKDKRRNIPTAELEPVMEEADKSPIRVAYERRNRDLDPQLVWRGKDEQDWSDLIVQAPPLYIQEKIHPKVLIDDLLRQSRARRDETNPVPAKAGMPDLFADFNGLPDKEAVTEFYQHDANWSNRMILQNERFNSRISGRPARLFTLVWQGPRAYKIPICIQIENGWPRWRIRL